MISSLTYICFREKEDGGTHRPDWLPVNAENVNFVERKSFFAIARQAEFYLGQNDFAEFASSKGLDVRYEKDFLKPPMNFLNDSMSVGVLKEAMVCRSGNSNLSGIYLVYDIKKNIVYYTQSNR